MSTLYTAACAYAHVTAAPSSMVHPKYSDSINTPKDARKRRNIIFGKIEGHCSWHYSDCPAPTRADYYLQALHIRVLLLRIKQKLALKSYYYKHSRV